MSDLNNYTKILLDLIHLRQTDYDAFMNRLYEALTGEFKDVIHDSSPVEDKTQAIWTMIKHFEKNEEFEKCADLKKLADELNPQWRGQSFDNIIMTNTETTLSSIYNIMYESFIKDYAKIEYNRNYIVEYTVNGVSNICVLRYFQLATLNKITNKAELKEYRIYCKIIFLQRLQF